MNTKLLNHTDTEKYPHTATVVRDGNFTICLLRKGKKKIDLSEVYVGVSKCNPNYDICDRVRGDEIAYLRAIKKAFPARKKKAQKVPKK